MLTGAVSSQNQEKENGFYVNYGSTKIEKLDCFNFDNIVYTHEVTEEMLKYDKIVYGVRIYNTKTKEYDVLNYTKSLDGKIYRNKVSDKKYISFAFISDKNLESKNRKNTAFTADEELLDNMVIRVFMNGGVITGYEEKWNRYTESFIKEPIYTYTGISPHNNELKVVNRQKRTNPELRTTIIGSIIYLFISKKKKDRTIDTTGNCFNYDGDETYDTFLINSI